MKTVLIPTDFDVESVKIIDSLIFNNKGESVGIIFMHAFKLSDSITDLLMLKRRSKDHENVSLEFYDRIDFYQKKYADQIKFIGIEYFYGSTVAAFRNFIEAINADFILFPKNYSFKALNKLSIDPNLLTNRCGCHVVELDVNDFSTEEKLYETKIPQEEKHVQNI